MSVTTSALILGGTAAFTAGAAIAGRPFSEPESRAIGLSREAAPRIALAAALLLALTAFWLVAFIAEVSQSFGLRAALVNSPEVRTAIGSGGTAWTIKYVYAAFAAAVLSSVAASIASSHRERLLWLGAAGLCALAMYFSTGRSNIVVAVVAGAIAYALARPLRPSVRRLLAGTAVIGAVALVSLVALGAVIGKTFANSELATIESVFTEHDMVQVLALPYQYASAPVAALNELVAVATTLGRADGCATVPAACQIARGAGFDAEPEPVVRGFTGRPGEWNTYTGLDAPLMDGGLVLTVPILGALGLLTGWAWREAASGAPRGIVLYSVLGTAAGFSTGQNRFFDSFFLACALLGLAAWGVAGRVKAVLNEGRTREPGTSA
jgi:oligosaccharide repeat unit polymerase